MVKWNAQIGAFFFAPINMLGWCERLAISPTRRLMKVRVLHRAPGKMPWLAELVLSLRNLVKEVRLLYRVPVSTIGYQASGKSLGSGPRHRRFDSYISDRGKRRFKSYPPFGVVVQWKDVPANGSLLYWLLFLAVYQEKRVRFPYESPEIVTLFGIAGAYVCLKSRRIRFDSVGRDQTVWQSGSCDGLQNRRGFGSIPATVSIVIPQQLSGSSKRLLTVRSYVRSVPGEPIQSRRVKC